MKKNSVYACLIFKDGQLPVKLDFVYLSCVLSQAANRAVWLEKVFS